MNYHGNTYSKRNMKRWVDTKDIIREILRSKNPNICLDCDLGMF